MSTAVAHLLIILTSLIIAATFVVAALITDQLDPELLTLIRFLLAVVLFCPWMLFRFGWRTTFTVAPRKLFRCALVSLCLTGFFIGMFHALRYTTALNTSVIYTLVPVISSLFSLLLVGERQSGRLLLALATGLIGALWVLCEGQISRLAALDWGYGDRIFALACVAIGLYPPLIKRFFSRGESMEVVTWWILVTGSGWLLAVTGGRLYDFVPASVSVGVWLGIGYLALFASIISFYFTQLCVPVLGATRVMAWSYTYPALVLLYDLLLGNPLPPPEALPGVAIVCLAMLLLSVNQPK